MTDWTHWKKRTPRLTTRQIKSQSIAALTFFIAFNASDSLNAFRLFIDDAIAY